MSGCNKDSSVPQPCVTGCGFMGSPENLSMCPQCYGAHLERESATNPTVNRDSTEKTNVSKAGTETHRKEEPKHQDDVENIQCIVDVLKDLKRRREDSDSSVKTTRPERKAQKLTHRCFTCRRRIGLTTFKCRCGYYYCANHRHAELHNCQFDYKAMNKDLLRKLNPIVKAPKVAKI
eukprot:CAMPEP_0184751642 /NCGR_PEP_ID=MMETSP0315-20130426/43147_1 /TAXON_ID=101924 /ORGANISM="Rhodosorus marinus, Strain UTEX LB 2760" /LENGTH=176 /DNA_ID=CAMNT_0027230917 /DNA_START=707 /DNA_END=1237 /DNA_ORIENTATION=-